MKTEDFKTAIKIQKSIDVLTDNIKFLSAALPVAANCDEIELSMRTSVVRDGYEYVLYEPAFILESLIAAHERKLAQLKIDFESL